MRENSRSLAPVGLRSYANVVSWRRMRGGPHAAASDDYITGPKSGEKKDCGKGA